MRSNRRRSFWVGASFLGMLAFSPLLSSQASPDLKKVAVPTDWSHHHVIFSKPATPEQAQRVERDPRYWQQIRRRSGETFSQAEYNQTFDVFDVKSRRGPSSRQFPKKRTKPFHGDWAEDMGSGATVGAVNFPAKYSFDTTTANCIGSSQPDFVVYNTGLAGVTGTQANIAAYDNLYSGCSVDGTVPTVYWAYDTGGAVITSPVLSQDGQQAAYVQDGGGFSSTLVLLRWAASVTETISNPMTLSDGGANQYFGCTAPCMALFALKDSSGTANSDSYSSVFYDYSTDVAYVGDDAGWLHQFTPFFKGTPAEVRNGVWPLQVNPSAPTALTGPVYDSATGNVFVTDNGGFLYAVDPTTGAVTISGQLDFSAELDFGPGLLQGPVVDSTAGWVYVFAPSDGGNGSCNSSSDCSAVYQLSNTFVGGSTGSEVTVGASTVEPTTPNPLYVGDFDSTYINSVNATGNLYVCGNTGGTPALYQVAFENGIPGSVRSGPVLSSSATPCSSVTDILNPNAAGSATEWIFASAQTGGVSTVCASGGCIYNFKNTPWLASTSYTVGQEVVDTYFNIEFVFSGGTSGASTPSWNSSTAGSTPDGTVTWLDLGPASAFPPASWIRTHHYSRGAQILDGNGNLEMATVAGISGSTIPSFNGTIGGTTKDGSSPNQITWTNVGPPATAAMPVAGGTSGIIVDNTVSSGTIAGASQVYFSTLSNQACGTSGTGGCAVQASQAALK